MVQLSNFTFALSLFETGSNIMQRLGLGQSLGSQSIVPASNATTGYALPPLGYSYDALEPDFDAMTMEIHHSRHHQTYVNNLNAALKDDAHLSSLGVEDLIQQMEKVPADKKTAVRNQGGGHANHSFFWKNLKRGTQLTGDLESAIITTFGSVDDFKAEFEKAAISVFGSGWAWLVVNEGTLKVVKTSNQDSPLMGESVAGASGFPIIALDVWEHAYYLQYHNRRQNYIKGFWNVVNWEFASECFSEIKEALER